MMRINSISISYMNLSKSQAIGKPRHKKNCTVLIQENCAIYRQDKELVA